MSTAKTKGRKGWKSCIQLLWLLDTTSYTVCYIFEGLVKYRIGVDMSID